MWNSRPWWAGGDRRVAWVKMATALGGLPACFLPHGREEFQENRKLLLIRKEIPGSPGVGCGYHADPTWNAA